MDADRDDTGVRTAGLTPAQAEAWIAAQLSEPDALMLCEYFDIRGPVRVPVLDRAFAQACAEAPAVSARFATGVNGRPVQVLPNAPRRRIDVCDLRHAPDPAAAAQEWMREDRARGADVAGDDLHREYLLVLADDHHYWYRRFHQIVMDGYSESLFVRRVVALYNAFCAQEQPEPSSFETLDALLEDEEAYHGSPQAAEDLRYWTECFADRPAPVRLGRLTTTARAEPRREDCDLTAEEVRQLVALADELGVSWTRLAIALVALCVHRATGSTDVVLSLPVTGRATRVARRAPVMMSKVLPLRVRIDPTSTVRRLVAHTSDALGGLLRHQRTAVSEIRSLLDLPDERTSFFGPLVNIMQWNQNLDLDGSPMTLRNFNIGRVEDVQFVFDRRRRDGGIAVQYEASPDACDADETAAMAAQFRTVLRQVLAGGADLRLVAVSLLTAEQEQELLSSRAGGGALPPVPPSIPAAFAAQVEQSPHAVAVMQGPDRVTYAELDRAAARLAGGLRALGARRSTIVAIQLERSIDLVTAVLAVTRTGAAYTVVDTAFPRPRRLAVLADADPVVILTRVGCDDGLDQLSEAERRVVDVGSERPDWPVWSTDDAPEIGPDDVACAMYTSGSTGAPKGVLVPHRAVVRTMVGQSYLGFAADEVYLQSSAVSWDACALELFGALFHGGTCVLPSGNRIDIDEIARLVHGCGITVLQLSASLFNTLVDDRTDVLGAVRAAMTAGEAASPAHVERARALYPELALSNGYGPVESMGITTCHVIERLSTGDRQSVPIGTAIAGKSAYLLDGTLRPVPVGVLGELYVAGEGLAHGYLGRPRPTAERFIADPFGPAGTRMYRTGDRGRRRADGALDFVGRDDDQVKIRGVRVEPAEVENAVARHPDVAQVRVLAVPGPLDGAPRLVAYVVAHPGTALTRTDLRAHTAELIAEHLVPLAFALLDALPLTPNGKLDRRSLPAVSFEASGRRPRTPREELLCILFAEVLGVDRVGVDDNFFEAGGHSLSATRLVGRVRSVLGLDVGIRELFRSPTVESLSQRLEPGTVRPALVPVDRSGLLPMSFAQYRLWFLRQFESVASTYNVPVALRVTGELDVAPLRAAAGDVVARHESLRTVFSVAEGPPCQHVLAPSAGRPSVRVVLCGPGDPDEVDAVVAAEVEHGFDLAHEIPLRVTVCVVSPREFVVVVLLHHIAADGWSMGPLGRDLAEAYAARRAGKAPHWATLPVQYADYAVWQRELLGSVDDPGSVAAKQLRFWRDLLDGLPEELALPVDRPRPPAASHRGATVPLALDADLHAALVAVTRERGATVFMALHAALVALLNRLGVGDDVPVGTAVAGRTEGALDDLVGFFVNTLVLRTDASGRPSFATLLERARDVALNAYAHQDLPFDRLVEELNPPRHPARHPLFQVMLSLNIGESTWGFEGVDTEPYPLDYQVAKFDLSVRVEERHGQDGRPCGITAVLDYSTDLFDHHTAAAFADHYTQLLHAMVDDLNQVALEVSTGHAIVEHPPVAELAGADSAGPVAGDAPTVRGPRSPQEELMCGLFAEVLGVDRVGVDDNFFALGGYSLSATRLVSRIRSVLGSEVGIRQLFGSPTVAGLSQRLEPGAVRPALVGVDRSGLLPMSFAQYRLWFLRQFESAATTYNVPVAFRVRGVIDVDALRAAVEDVVARHESLRTVFSVVEGQPCQRVVPAPSGESLVRVLECVSGEVDAVVAAEADHAFDLAREVPLRVTVCTVSPQDAVLVVLLHHIAADGWSMRPLGRDLAEAYAARRAGVSPQWVPIPVQYGDYAMWQRELLGAFDDPGSVASRQLSFWRGVLDTVPDELALPVDRPRSAEASHHGATVRLDLDAELHARLVDLARERGVTLFMVLHAGLVALLTRLGSGEDVPVGTAVAGRTDDALDDLVGFFVNTLVLRTDASGRPSFATLLERVRDVALNAYAHQDLPFDRLVEELNPPRHPARHPLFQVMLVLNAGDDVWQLPGLDTTAHPVEHHTADFDLFFGMREFIGAAGRPQGIDIGIDYSTDLFDAETAAAIANHYLRLLHAMGEDPDQSIDAVALATGDPLVAVSGPQRVDARSFVHEVFEDRAREVPDATAVVDDRDALTFAQLDRRANAVAWTLIDRGLGPEDRVAVLVPRSVDAVVAWLGVHKAGAAYVPIDSTYPAERIQLLLADAAVAATITTTATATTMAVVLPDEPVLLDEPVTVRRWTRTAILRGGPTDADRVRPLQPAHQAYVIYTSGSTGRPKGVVVEHRQLTNLLRSHEDTVFARHAAALAAAPRRTCTSPLGRIAMTAPLAFDASWMGLLAIVVGAELHLLAEPVRSDVDRLARYITEHHIDLLDTTPLYATELVRLGLTGERGPRTLALGGEAIPAALWRTLREAPELAVHNFYGPTECTVETTWCPLDEAASPALGSAVAGARLSIRDDDLRPVPATVPGELYVSGPGVARGYLGMPGLTAARFIADPTDPAGGRMYRTGDLVRRRWDCTLEFLGRTDDQVKLRGIRIELGEIEAALLQQPGVAQAVAVVDGAADARRLVGYVVPTASNSCAGADLRQRMIRVLPGHLVPSAVVVVDQLPRTRTGKLDRDALPAPLADTGGGSEPTTPAESQICQVYADVLGVDTVGPDDDFFVRGGSSLLATRLTERLTQALGMRIDLPRLFADPTPRALAGMAHGGLRTPRTGGLVTLRAGSGSPSLFCVHPVTGLSWCYFSLAGSIGGDDPVYGLQSPLLAAAPAPPHDFDELVESHVETVLRTDPGGPYRLLGWSMGGTLAHSIACRLQELGKEVTMLALLDARPPVASGCAADPAPTRAQIVELLGREGGPDATDKGLTDVLTRVAAEHVAVLATATPRTFDGDALVLPALGGVRPTAGDVEHWTPFVTGRLERHAVACAHEDMTQPDAVAVVAPVVDRALRRSTARPGTAPA